MRTVSCGAWAKVALVLTLLPFSGPVGKLQAAPPQDFGVGEWRFASNLSRYESGPAPRISTRIWRQEGDQVRFVHNGIDAGGRPFHVEFLAGYNGEAGQVTGSPMYNEVQLQWQTPYVTRQTFLNRGEAVVRATRTISKDRQRMTILATGKRADGKPFTNRLVYLRVR